jgi:hypothetical protein
MTPSRREFPNLIGSTAISTRRFGNPQALKPNPGRRKISPETSSGRRAQAPYLLH